MNKAKPTLKNIIAYIQGNLRYKLYYSNNKLVRCLMRKHIREQIKTRINSMDSQCYLEGQCKICGCHTTALQMANKACDKPCYPKMLYKKDWEILKRGVLPLLDNNIYWTIKNNKFVIYE